MATFYNMHEAKTQLSMLIARVEKGEEIVIARKGVPVAHLVPVPPTQRKFRYGQHADLVPETFLDDWDEWKKELRSMFAEYVDDPE